MTTTDEARLAELAESRSLPWRMAPDGTVFMGIYDCDDELVLGVEYTAMGEYAVLAANLAPVLLAERDALLAQSAALRDQLARVTEALVEERARGNWGAEGNIDWEDQTGYSFGYGTDEIGVQDFYRRDARKQLAAEALAARTPTPGAAGEVG